jgi:hypothetical protein
MRGPITHHQLHRRPSVIEKILRHLKLWERPERPPPTRAPMTLDCDADFLAAAAASRRFEGID